MPTVYRVPGVGIYRSMKLAYYVAYEQRFGNVRKVEPIYTRSDEYYDGDPTTHDRVAIVKPDGTRQID